MGEKRLNRKVTVIFATDVVGYSKHVEDNESLTIKTYSVRETVLLKLIGDFQGRVFNTGGDSVLAEFSSAVDAVECAATFQMRMTETNSKPDTECRLEFRVGINMGDVIQKNENLLGDGVNIAARLEAFAQHSGVCISKSVYDLVATKTDFTFNDLGIQRVKDNKFHAFDLVLPHTNKRVPSNAARKKTPMLLAFAFLVFGIIVSATFLMPKNDYSDGGSIDADKVPISSFPVVLVMPLRTSGLSKDQSELAKGFTESMITTLASYDGVTVLSSSTSYHAQKSEMLDEEIKREFGVDHIIRGSMQIIGQKGRLNLEITDIDLGTVTGTKQKDFDINNIFEVQDQLSYEILQEMQINVGNSGSATASKIPFDSMEDYTAFLNWRIEWRKENEESYFKSLSMLEELDRKNPELSMSIWFAWQLFKKTGLGLSADPEADSLEMSELINKSFANPNSDQSMNYAARALIGLNRLQRSCEDSIKDADKALEYPTTADILMITGYVYNGCGKLEKGIAATRRALRLTPNDSSWFITRNLVLALFMNRQFEEIAELVNAKIDATDMHPDILIIWAYLKFKNGDKKEAEGYWERATNIGFELDKRRWVSQLPKDLKKDLETTLTTVSNSL